MNPNRRKWFSLLVELAIRFRGDRPSREDMAQRMDRASFKSNVSRLGLRMTEFLRDRLRPRWLRTHRDDR